MTPNVLIGSTVQFPSVSLGHLINDMMAVKLMKKLLYIQIFLISVACMHKGG